MSKQLILWVCPSCAAVKMGTPNDTCTVCGCPVISTDVIYDEYLTWPGDKRREWKEQMVQKYAAQATGDAKIKRAEFERTTTADVFKKVSSHNDSCASFSHSPETNIHISISNDQPSPKRGFRGWFGRKKSSNSGGGSSRFSSGGGSRGGGAGRK